MAICICHNPLSATLNQADSIAEKISSQTSFTVSLAGHCANSRSHTNTLMAHFEPKHTNTMNNTSGHEQSHPLLTPSPSPVMWLSRTWLSNVPLSLTPHSCILYLPLSLFFQVQDVATTAFLPFSLCVLSLQLRSRAHSLSLGVGLITPRGMSVWLGDYRVLPQQKQIVLL